MNYVIEVLRQEHYKIERLLRVLERELSVFNRGGRPDYEVILAVLEYFKDYPDSCHHRRISFSSDSSYAILFERPALAISNTSIVRERSVCGGSLWRSSAS